MALFTRKKLDQNSCLIHHSDRGSQYCSFQYVSILIEASVRISMTENGDPSGAPGDENAIAERVNGILKADFRLNRVFKSQAEAVVATEMAVHNYNTLRPHMSCDYLTPQAAHMLDQLLQKHWKKKKLRNV